MMTKDVDIIEAMAQEVQAEIAAYQNVIDHCNTEITRLKAINVADDFYRSMQEFDQ
jgi:hypothetical protein